MVRDWEEIDRGLRPPPKDLGYLGMALPAQYDREGFLAIQRVMALVVAARIDGAKFKKISYGYHSDDELKRMGFEPYP